MASSARIRLYPAAFSGGFATLAVELSATRLVGPAFGTSNAVWAAVIGLILLYLTVGYYLGGAWADRRGAGVLTVYVLTSISSLAIVAIPAVAPMVVASCSAMGLGAGAGAFLSVAVLFGPAMITLGSISPIAVKAAVSDLVDAGRVTGKLYAISTVGSLVGAFMPVLWWLPEWGTSRTFLSIAGIQAIVGLAGLGAEALRRTSGEMGGR